MTPTKPTAPVVLSREEAERKILELLFPVASDKDGEYIDLKTEAATARFKRFAPQLAKTVGGQWVTLKALPSPFEDAATSKALRDELKQENFRCELKDYLSLGGIWLWLFSAEKIDKERRENSRFYFRGHECEFTAVALVYLWARTGHEHRLLEPGEGEK